MAVDLSALLAPTTTAVVTSECQNGVLGPDSALPELAAAARDTVVPNGSRLVHGARTAGVQVLHAVFWRRLDNRGANTNGRMFVAMNKVSPPMLPGSEAALPIPEFGLSPDDLVLGRYHGLDPVGGTDLDPILRNLGVRTVVVVGVSLNVALMGLSIGLVNAGYQVVVPRDAVAGVPDDYARALLANSYALVATVVTTDEVLDAWG
ncbi:MAG: cysteine hydrolase [Acidimicrobiales bacterium]|jgi:nicotinamidase-related amidase|nr:cysteine hydrolase [Acidimicrobiales bacterium]